MKIRSQWEEQIERISRNRRGDGDWPGLDPEQLYENRDLNLTTDFRDVLGEVVTKQLGNKKIETVFPGFNQPKFRGLMIG